MNVKNIMIYLVCLHSAIYQLIKKRSMIILSIVMILARNVCVCSWFVNRNSRASDVALPRVVHESVVQHDFPAVWAEAYAVQSPDGIDFDDGVRRELTLMMLST